MIKRGVLHCPSRVRLENFPSAVMSTEVKIPANKTSGDRVVRSR